MVPKLLNVGELSALYFAHGVAEREYARVLSTCKAAYLGDLRAQRPSSLMTHCAGTRGCRVRTGDTVAGQGATGPFERSVFAIGHAASLALLSKVAFRRADGSTEMQPIASYDGATWGTGDEAAQWDIVTPAVESIARITKIQIPWVHPLQSSAPQRTSYFGELLLLLSISPLP
ncbi:uncharacterized protein BDR25DRAFT_364559 [Lindgomyces ingoldianus]|uniref:Uncharacterized protein n=1 Tax=Lindgomyces ingoldianus TaxID=673940 RepID=A0ACB6RGP2_9PLEO|nr:uncharacterized protein BDR25DRAFT_364559 [Lindgomyces ingoldianus]KAF2477672.1 hypothetical protein BDR25DRAFT_364559 [Lindgomyces ingoldianus]